MIISVLLTAAVGVCGQTADEFSLTELEQELVSGLTDGTDWVGENAFYKLLERISDRPDMSKAQLASLDSPATRNLLRNPPRYRFHPIRLSVRVHRIVKLSVGGRTISPNYYWDDARAIYEVQCTDAAIPADENPPPLLVFMDHLPPELPKPGRTENGDLRYGKMPRYTVAGIYYKYITRAGMGDGIPHDYPVILAWQMDPVGGVEGGEVSSKLLGGIVLLTAVGAVAIFFFIKRAILGKRTQRPTFGDYRPLRDTDSDDQADRDQPVDPELTDAVRQHKTRED